MLYPVSAQAKPTMPVSATPSRGGFANRSIPALRDKPKHSQQKKQKICTPSRQRRHFHTPALHFQRACRQCVHESARLFRALCSHAWYSRNRGKRDIADFSSALCRTHLPRMARAANSCTRGMNQCTQCVGWRRRDRGEEFSKRGGTLSLMTFGTFRH